MTQRFLIFPDGAQGWALLLFRLSLAARLGAVIDRTISGVALTTAALLVTLIALAAGARTREAAAVCVLFVAYRSTVERELSLLLAGADVLQAAALLVVGPGSLSVDARLYGRSRVSLKSGNGSDG